MDGSATKQFGHSVTGRFPGASGFFARAGFEARPLGTQEEPERSPPSLETWAWPINHVAVVEYSCICARLKL